MNPEETAITDVLMAYQTAINQGDLDAVVALYAPDAVLMAPGSPSVVGAEAIRAAYTSMLQAMSFDLTFQVAEAHQLSTDWGFVRTSSKGTLYTRETKQPAPEGNQELFLFQKRAGDWKIARYCFNAVIPS